MNMDLDVDYTHGKEDHCLINVVLLSSPIIDHFVHWVKAYITILNI